MAAVGHLLWLKLRLLAGSYRHSPWRMLVAVILGALLAAISLAVYLVLVVLFGALSDEPRAVHGLLTLLLHGLYVFWIVLPLLGLQLNDTADPSKLLLFPVSYRQAFVGTFLGNALDLTVLFGLPWLVAIPVGLAPNLPLGLLMGALLLAFLAHTLALTQVLQLALWGLLRSRRFRDLAIILGSLLGTGVWIAQQTLMSHMMGSGLQRLLFFQPWEGLRYLPPGIAAEGVLSALRGSVGGTLGSLAVLLLLTAATTGAAGWLMHRLYTGEMTLGRQPGPRRLRPQRSLLSRRLPWLPSPVQSLAWKDLRSYARDPALKVRLFQAVGSTFLLPLVLSYQGVLRGVAAEPVYVLLGAGAVLLFGASALASNQFASEGEGISLLFSFACPRRWLLMGKNAGLLAILSVAMAVVVLVTTLLTGAWELVVPGCILLEASLLVVLGAGNLMSIYLPYRLARRGENPFATGGPGCLAGVLWPLVHLLTMLLAAPVGLALAAPVAARMPSYLWVSVPLGAAYAVLVYLGLLSVAARHLQSRETEILQAMVRYVR